MCYSAHEPIDNIMQVYITMAYNPTRFSQHPEMFFCATSQQVFASVCERVRVRGQATRFSQHPKMFFSAQPALSVCKWEGERPVDPAALSL